MRSVPISHSITGPLARSIGPGFTGAERGKALTNAGGPSGPPFGVHYNLRLAGQVPPPEQGPREERPVVGIVHQAGHDPVDVSPASPLRCGRRIPLSRCSLNRPYGTVTEPKYTFTAAGSRRRLS